MLENVAEDDFGGGVESLMIDSDERLTELSFVALVVVRCLSRTATRSSRYSSGERP